MAREQLRKVGRPSKGDRHPFNVKLPISDAEKTRELAKIYGMDAGPLIAERFVEWLNTVDLTEAQSQVQEQFPMTG